MTARLKAETLTYGEGRSPARARAEGEVGADCDENQERDSRHAHHAGPGDVPRAFRLDAGHRRNGGDDDREAEPSSQVMSALSSDLQPGQVAAVPGCFISWEG